MTCVTVVANPRSSKNVNTYGANLVFVQLSSYVANLESRAKVFAEHLRNSPHIQSKSRQHMLQNVSQQKHSKVIPNLSCWTPNLLMGHDFRPPPCAEHSPGELFFVQWVSWSTQQPFPDGQFGPNLDDSWFWGVWRLHFDINA